MEAYPGQAVVQDETRRHGFFREVLRVDPMVLEAVEVKAALFKLNNGNFSFALCLNIPIEIELPGGDWLRQVAIFIAECNAQLYDLQLIDTVLDCNILTLVFRSTFKITLEEARELSVHRNICVCLEQFCYFGKFVLKVVHPDILNV